MSYGVRDRVICRSIGCSGPFARWWGWPYKVCFWRGERAFARIQKAGSAAQPNGGNER